MRYFNPIRGIHKNQPSLWPTPKKIKSSGDRGEENPDSLDYTPVKSTAYLNTQA